MIERGRFGPKLTLKRAWSEDVPELMKREGVQELQLSRIGAVDRDSLDFLADVPWLKGFSLLDIAIEDIEGVHFLTELRYLHLSDYSRKRIDFGRFPFLEECYMEFNKNRRSVSTCHGLTRLSLQHYSYRDLVPIAALGKLKELWISQGSLGDISGIAAFPKLTEITLGLLKNLSDIGPLSFLDDLQVLTIQGCKRVNEVDALAKCRALRSLDITSCGEIESLAPLVECETLEELRFFEDTKIKDGDIAVLLRMPNLKKARFNNRRHYNMRWEDLPEHLKAP